MAKRAAPTPETVAEPAEAEPALAAIVTIPPVRLSEPGVYDALSARDYHLDPCPGPSLSRSILKTLVSLSPAHAYVAHPRLGGLADADAEEGDEAADFGTAAHSAFLQGQSIIKRLDFKDWRTNAAKEARAQARADGLIPLLVRPYDRAMRLIEVLEQFRAATGAFTAGRAEQTVIWQDGPVWARARVDWLPDEPSAAPWDLKTTAGRATLQAWSRVAFETGADLQDAWYGRGLEFCRGEPADPMQFCVVEQSPPHGIGIFQMAPSTRQAAEDDVRYGLSLWEHCLATGLWPPYPLEPQWVFPPAWVSRAREERASGVRQMVPARQRAPAYVGEHPNAVRYVETGDFGG
jgi:hypothetical protein